MRILIKTFLFLIFILGIFISKQSFSQIDTSKYINSLRILSVEEGLSSREVLSGLQDKSGFIWLGTRNGLNRYDGNTFRQWHRKQGLQSERVVQIVNDCNQRLWILYGSNAGNRSSMGKCDIFNLNTLEIETFSNSFKNAPIAESEIAWFVSNEAGEIMIITKKCKIFLYSKSNKFIQRGDLNLDYNNLVTNHIFHGDNCWIQINGDKWFHSSASYSKYFNFSDKAYSIILLGLNIDTYRNLSGYFLKYTEPDLKFLESSFGYLDRLGTINYRNDLTSNFGQASTIENIYMYYDSRTNSSLIVNPPNNIFLFKGNELSQLIEPTLLKDKFALRVYGYFTDEQNQHWLMTNAGVFIVKKKVNHFSHYFTRAQVQPSQTEGNQIRGIYADTSGNVYACLWQYLIHQKPDKKTELIPFSSIGYSLGKFDSQLYIGNYSLTTYDFNTHIKTDFNLKGPLEIWSMFQSSHDNILFKRDEHFYKTIYGTNKTIKCSDFKMEVDKYIYRIFRARDDKIYTAGDNGIYVLNDQGVVTDHYFSNASDSSHRIPFDELHWLLEDANNIFWMVTKNEGLYRWDRKANTFNHFTIDDGLSTNDLYCILQDELGYLWLSSDYGLMRMDTADFTVKTYTILDGLSHNEFNRISCFQAADSRMYFGGLDGVNAFYPGDFTQDKVVYNANMEIISFNQFVGDENSLKNLTSELKSTKKIILKPGDKFFTVEFALLDFDHSANRFAYKINGVDRDWNYINENSIRISGLPEGEFTLQIKGQNNLGQWSANELIYKIIVFSPIYKKTWFIILVIVLTTILVFLIIHQRTLYLEKVNALLEKKVGIRTLRLQESIVEKESLIKMKDVLLREIHHRVKNNLQVISTLLQLQSNLLEDEKLKEVLMESQNRIHSIALIHQQLYQHEDFANINLQDFIEDLFKQVEVIFKREKILISCGYNIPVTLIGIDTAVPLGIIINEFFTNSFKYAFKEMEKGEITINLSQDNDDFELTYRDNGVGMSKVVDFTREKTLGLRLIYLLSKQLKGSVSYAHNRGAEFRIKFKIVTD